MESLSMLTDNPKLIFSDMGGNVTLEARLPCQQIKQAEKHTPKQQYLKALYTVGEAEK